MFSHADTLLSNLQLRTITRSRTIKEVQQLAVCENLGILEQGLRRGKENWGMYADLEQNDKSNSPGQE